MSRHSLIAIIAITLIGFILFKGAASFLCEPAVSNPVVNVISNAIPVPEPIKGAAQPDPFSWEPVMQRMAHFFSKACPK